MHTIVIDIPSRPGSNLDEFDPAYSSLCNCLTSCLPALTASEVCTELDRTGRLVCSLQLNFESERHWTFAQMSSEWVNLIDATSQLLDWDSARTRAAILPVNAVSPRKRSASPVH